MLSYQNILKAEFLNRSEKNSSYSLRAFSRDIGLSQSFLSLVLNKKRQLSDEMALRISETLKLKNSSKKLFINLVRLEQIKNPDSKRILQKEIDQLLKRQVNFKLLSEDVFKIVSEWHYFAIIELTSLKDFKNNSRWISRKLKISEIEVELALEKLIRVGLLVEENGQLKKTEKNYIFENVPSAAIRKHHHGTLELAQKALEEQDMSQREFFTVCFPMDPRLLPEAKRKIREFSEDLMREMEESNPLAIYKVAVQMFRLDQELK